MLLGAGATRGALSERVPPPPLDRDFFDVAGQIVGRGTRRLATRVIKDVFDLYGRVSGIGLEQYFRDIETRAEIGQFAKSRNRPKDWDRRKRDLEELIRRVLLHTTCNLEDGPASVAKSDVLEDVLSHLKAGDTVITFNYDTVIEESFPIKGPFWNPEDGYAVDATGKSKGWAKAFIQKRGDKASEIELVKLHGSLNWTLYATNKVRLKPRPYVVRARRGAPVADKCSILPPGWHKRIDVNPYRQLWSIARLRLESCSNLAVVGYSLPETDLLARALFAEISRLRSARHNYLKHLYLADRNDNVKAQILNVLVPALGSKGRVYQYNDLEDLRQQWTANGLNR